MLKKLILLVIVLNLTACSSFFDKDNTPTPRPLTPLKPEITPRQLWSTTVGGSGNEYLKLAPAISGNVIYTASANGVVTAINKLTGQTLWRTNTNACLSSGPGAGNGIVVVGSQKGEIIALDECNGRQRFRTSIPGEVIANPAVGNNIVIVKAVDGYVRALSACDGHELWAFQQLEPSLILRASSSPILHDGNTFIGFANGNLAKLGTRSGQLHWMTPIATPQGGFAIQRMIDIDADPVIYGHRIYAATYQGNISSLDWNSGSTLWSHDISSYTGMVADDNTIFISDAQSHIWAFGANSGLVLFKQCELEARNVSGPASQCGYIVVGDSEGFLHWLSKRDGHIAARAQIGGAIFAAPIAENNVIYALTSKGNLVAYTLS